jgi:hypothetical protein
VQTYLARGDLASDVPGFIQNWEERFYRQPLNHGRWMEQPLSAVITGGVIPVPNDYLNLKNIYLNGSPSSRLEFVSLEQLLGMYPRGDGTGIPLRVARERTNFIFGPEADSGYTIKGTYWGKPTLLRNYASDAAAHWIIVNAPDLPLYGALLEAEPFLKNDSRLVVWKSFYDSALHDYRDLMDAESHTMVAFEVLA